MRALRQLVLAVCMCMATGAPLDPTAAVAQQDTPGAWTRPIDLGATTSARALAVDAAGNVYVAGFVSRGSTSADAFVRKYDQSGRDIWTRQFGSSHTTEARSIAVDNVGDIIAAGGVEGELDGQSRSGFTDVFVRKYDSDGEEVWTRQFGSMRDAVAYGVTHDGFGNVVVAGFSNGALPGQPRFGYRDAFVRKYDRDGTELWTRQFGTSRPTEARAISADGEGHLYVVGAALGALPGQVGGASFSGFLRAYDPEGSELWTREFSSKALVVATAVATDATGSVYAAGYESGQTGAFLRRYTRDGEEVWTRGVGVNTRATGVAVDGSGRVHLAVQSEGEAFVLEYDEAGSQLGTVPITPSRGGVWGIVTQLDSAVTIAGDADAQTSTSAFVMKLPE